MRRAACATVLALSALALPHRLDEYLQLTTLSVAPGRVHATLFLTPGVKVAGSVVALIDANGDGLLSLPEKRDYAARVVRDLALSVDGAPRRLRVLAFRFPSVASMREGTGWIQLKLDAAVPVGSGEHTLDFENRHQRPVAAYLVECLAPNVPGLRVVAQDRSREQARYELRYVQDQPARLETR